MKSLLLSSILDTIQARSIEQLHLGCVPLSERGNFDHDSKISIKLSSKLLRMKTYTPGLG